VFSTGSSSSTNPAPALSSISPSGTTAGGTDFTLTVTGGNFVATSVVQWNGVSRPTTFVSSTHLQAAISTADFSTASTVQVAVVTPAPGGGTSTALTFTIGVPTSLPPEEERHDRDHRGRSGKYRNDHHEPGQTGEYRDNKHQDQRANEHGNTHPDHRGQGGEHGDKD
jgi:hypothetical protein